MGRSLSEVSRREERIFVAIPVTLRTGWDHVTVVNANTVDYSERGLRVRANAPLRLRQDVEVAVSDNPSLRKNYNVMWVREPSTGECVYEAGLEVERDRQV